MNDNNYKEKKMETPIEKFETAPLSNSKEKKPISNVNVPDEVQIRNSKEWVDTNQK